MGAEFLWPNSEYGVYTRCTDIPGTMHPVGIILDTVRVVLFWKEQSPIWKLVIEDPYAKHSLNHER
jgi:hypothetical protein